MVIAGGGTGGHVFPAVSIAEEFLNREGGNDVLFVGTRRGMEREVVTRLGYAMRFIKVGKFLGMNPLHKASALAVAAAATWGAARIIRSFAPDVVVGTGGYVAGPVVAAAALLRVPTLVCEQNSVPGLTNRVLGRMARRIAVGFAEGARHFPAAKTVVTGNPVRRSIVRAAACASTAGRPEDGRLTVLVVGGSQGARTLNRVMPRALAIVGRAGLRVIHQTGRAERDTVAEAYAAAGIEAEVHGFIEHIEEAYLRADLVVCRAGAGTIAEITVMGLPALLVPYPHAAHDHQRRNAEAMERAGAARVVDEKKLTAEAAAEVLREMMSEGVLERMKRASRELGRPEAAAAVVDAVYELAAER